LTVDPDPAGAVILMFAVLPKPPTVAETVLIDATCSDITVVPAGEN
jgi:hypothetical protein